MEFLTESPLCFFTVFNYNPIYIVRQLLSHLLKKMPKRHVTVFSFHDGHDAGAAIIRNGCILAAVQEERLRNIKHFGGTPTLAMQEVFRIAQIHPSEIDVVAIANCTEKSVSVAFEEIEEKDWAEKVYQPDILDKKDSLYKEPGYNPFE